MPRTRYVTKKAKAPAAAPAAPLPQVSEINEVVAMRVVDEVARCGDLYKACNIALPPDRQYAEFILWKEARPTWKNAIEKAEAAYAGRLGHNAVVEAAENFDWAEVAELPVAEQKLRVDAFYRHKTIKIDAMQALAARLGPKQTGAPAVVANFNNASGGETSSYANLLRAAEEFDRRPVIEHDVGDEKK